VWNNEVEGLDHFVAEEKNVEVYLPWPPSPALAAADLYLDLLQSCKQILRRQRRIDSDNSIEEIRLLGTDGIGVVDARHSFDRKSVGRIEKLDGLL
jgi:hypothetical protein